MNSPLTSMVPFDPLTESGPKTIFKDMICLSIEKAL